MTNPPIIGAVMTKERAPARPTCTWHCAACDRHFHSVNAFDAHRVDGECAEPETVLSKPSAQYPGGQPKLALWTAEGHCDKMPGCWIHGVYQHHVSPVEIWQSS